MVIYGADGDLTKRKLMPALYRLMYERRLSPGFAVVGVSRTPMSHHQFREKMRESVRQFLEDRQGQLWIGLGSGLSRWDGAAFHNYYVEDGLSYGHLYSSGFLVRMQSVGIYLDAGLGAALLGGRAGAETTEKTCFAQACGIAGQGSYRRCGAHPRATIALLVSLTT